VDTVAHRPEELDEDAVQGSLLHQLELEDGAGPRPGLTQDCQTEIFSGWRSWSSLRKRRNAPLPFHEPGVWTRSGRSSEMGIQTSQSVDVAASGASSRRRAGYQISEWVLAILGVVGTIVGAFILVGPENCCVVRYPSLSWRMGDIDPAWGYGLLVGGILTLVATVALVVRGRRHRAPSSGTG
jgi:hypothetical protein